MASVDPKGNETYWVEGEPFKGIRLEATKVGSEKYWLNGTTTEDLTPAQNFDTGKFFLLFE